MIKRLPIYLIIVLLASGLNYFSTKSIVFTLIIAAVGLLMFCLIAEPYLKKFELKQIRTKECVWFINNFLITLSINQSIRLTFETMKESFSKTLKQQVKLNEHLDVESQIRQLKYYFNSDLYNVFLNLLDQYIYNGGEILKISQILMFDTRKVGESLDNHISLLVRKVVEFMSLWVMTFLILIIMKIALNDFYDQIANNLQFKVGILIFFIVFYINIAAFIFHGFNLNFIKSGEYKTKKKKGGMKNEQPKRKNGKSKQSAKN